MDQSSIVLLSLCIFVIVLAIILHFAKRRHWQDKFGRIPWVTKILKYLQKPSSKSSKVFERAAEATEEGFKMFGSCLLFIIVFGIIAVVVIAVIMWAFRIVF